MYVLVCIETSRMVIHSIEFMFGFAYMYETDILITIEYGRMTRQSKQEKKGIHTKLVVKLSILW